MTATDITVRLPDGSYRRVSPDQVKRLVTVEGAVVVARKPTDRAETR